MDGETLGSLILALFIGCTQLDASIYDPIMLMIALQYGDVKNSLRLRIYEYKLVQLVVKCNYKGISSFVVARNRPYGPKR